MRYHVLACDYDGTIANIIGTFESMQRGIWVLKGVSIFKGLRRSSI